MTSLLVCGLVHAGLADDAARRARRYRGALADYWWHQQADHAFAAFAAALTLTTERAGVTTT